MCFRPGLHPLEEIIVFTRSTAGFKGLPHGRRGERGGKWDGNAEWGREGLRRGVREKGRK